MKYLYIAFCFLFCYTAATAQFARQHAIGSGVLVRGNGWGGSLGYTKFFKDWTLSGTATLTYSKSSKGYFYNDYLLFGDWSYRVLSRRIGIDAGIGFVGGWELLDKESTLQHSQVAIKGSDHLIVGGGGVIKLSCGLYRLNKPRYFRLYALSRLFYLHGSKTAPYKYAFSLGIEYIL